MTRPSDASRGFPSTRAAMGAGAVVLGVLAVFLPTGWYDSIPRLPGVSIPFSGAELLRWTLAAEALVLGVLALLGVRFRRMDSMAWRLVPPRREVSFDIGLAPAVSALALITAGGLALRIIGLDQDLWLDEITPIVDYTRLSVAQIMGSYLRSNNHLMNTILLKASIGVFGESEWSARLPAVIFGTLTIPALYWTARAALSRVGSLAAAMMLATSYHHVFFSQNARGYTAYLFFALISTGLLIGALRDDQLWRWALYVLAMVLGSASLLITAFVLAGHALVLLATGTAARRRGVEAAAFARRSVAVLGVAGLLTFQVYAAALPEAYVVIRSVYAEQSAGFAPFSLDFLREMARGLGAGFGHPLLAALFLALGGIGFAALCFLCWPLAASLVLPPVLTIILIGVRGLAFSPRFLLLLVPLAMLAAASAVQAAATLASRRAAGSSRVGRAVVILGATVLAAAAGRSLEYYYRTPKQPYRAALRLVESRFGSDRIIVVSNAAGGFRYYLGRMPETDPGRYVYTRSAPEFDSLTTVGAGENPQVLTTFPRALGIESPGIASRLRAAWRPDTVFAATVGDGEITVWSRREAPREPGGK